MTDLTDRLRELAQDHDPTEIAQAANALWPMAMHATTRTGSMLTDVGDGGEPVIEGGEVVGYTFTVEALRVRDVAMLTQARRQMVAEMAAADADVADVHTFRRGRG